MFELKPLSSEAIPAALAKAERYRLLNEPWQAESICRDILAVDPGHQDALVTLILALTDQFDESASHADEARELVRRLNSGYERAYYAGIICERRGMALFRKNGTGSYEWIREAMELYEKAEPARPHGNDDAILRWNTCARFLMRRPELARTEEATELPLLE